MESRELKSNLFWGVLLAVIVLASAGAMLLLRTTRGGIANIYSNGQLVETIDLAAIGEPYTITVEIGRAANFGANTIEVERGRIRVSDANCKGGDCIRQGWVSGGISPIVCLPHGLVIQVEGNSDVDGVVG